MRRPNPSLTIPRIWGFPLAIAGGIIASLAFHPSWIGTAIAGENAPTLGFLGWIAFAPAILLGGACDRRRGAIGYTALYGLIWFALTCQFLTYVHPGAWIGSSLGFAVMFGLLGWAMHALRRYGLPMFALTAPLAWVAFDWLLATAGLKFPWLFPAYTQLDVATNLVQTADLFGVYGTSLIVLQVNACLAGLLLARTGWGRPVIILKLRRRAVPRTESGLLHQTEIPTAITWVALWRLRIPIGLAIGLVIFGSGYGAWRLADMQERTVSGPAVALLQTNVQVGLQRDPADRGAVAARITAIVDALQSSRGIGRSTTMIPALRDELGATGDQQELIIQRETDAPIELAVMPENFPFDFPEFPTSLKRMAAAYQRLGVPWVWNGTQSEIGEDGKLVPGLPGNTSGLFSPEGELIATYTKRELVPVGEYVPFRDWTSLTTDFTRSVTGREPLNLRRGVPLTIFEIARQQPLTAEVDWLGTNSVNGEWRFATPICFESCFPDLCRRMVIDGAQMLIVQSDDSWFAPSVELEQVWLGARFRAIENRVGLARAVSSGVTGVVGPNGAMTASLRAKPEPGSRHWGFAGALVVDIPIGPAGALYTEIGDVLPIGAMLFVLFLLLLPTARYWLDWLIRRIKPTPIGAEADGVTLSGAFDSVPLTLPPTPSEMAMAESVAASMADDDASSVAGAQSDDDDDASESSDDAAASASSSDGDRPAPKS